MTENKRERYDPQAMEPKWRQRWEDSGLYKTVEDPDRPKFYFLTMLPYTSGDLHIGHWYAMAPSDAAARYRRMKGYNVFFPIGFDAFGLPAENAAIQRGIHPHTWTMQNVENMRRQLRNMGAMWAWDHEAVSCLPGYYKWTEWFFLKFYEQGLAYKQDSPVDFCPRCNTTLAREQVWGDDRHCERCGTPVIKKDLDQWFFGITNYAEELLDFSKIDWPERVQTMQTNWIGRSEGADVTFQSEAGDEILIYTTRPDTLWGATFMVLAPEHPLVAKLTTDDHREEVEAYVAQARRQSDIEREAVDKEKTGVFIGAYAVNPVNGQRIPIWIADYVLMTYGTGAIMAVPAHDERDFQFALKFGLPIIPVIDRTDGLAKSYVSKGTTREGLAEALAQAGIAFQARDGSLRVTLQGQAQIDRYVEMVREHLLPGCWVDVVGAAWLFIFDDGVVPLGSVESDGAILARCKALLAAQGITDSPLFAARTTMEALNLVEWYRDVLFHAEYGDMINSGAFSGTPGDVAKQEVTAWLEQEGKGSLAVRYRLHDWLISRQRYWGAPIPMIYCDQCGIVPVPYEDLPVLLPEDAEFLPTGESPLKYHEGFVNTTCPQCGGPARRETDTMDTFMCSSWYQYAYISPYYEGEVPFDPEKGRYWLPVDQYTGGIEHATMHLLYTRFFTKVMRDMGLVDFDEPMLRLFNQGIILGEDSEKMSKSRGNVINPDDLVGSMGADTTRAYLMFIGPWDEGGPWNSQGIEGVYRFLNRVWEVATAEPAAQGEPSQEDVRDLQRITHKTIARVTDDIEAFRLNTMLAAMMEFNNYLMKAKDTPVIHDLAWGAAVRALVLMLAPSCPHIAEELWERMGGAYSVHEQAWPESDPELAKDDVITLIVQVNGKVRDRLEVSAGLDEEALKELALQSDGAQRHSEGKKILKVIVAGGRLVNIVAR